MPRTAKLNDRDEAGRTHTNGERETVPDWSVIAGLRRSRIVELVEEHTRLEREKKEIEARLREIKDEGVRALVKADVKTVMVGEARVTRMDGSSSRLDKVKLAKKHGAKVLDWIADCTVKTPYTTLLVTLPKKEEGEDEE